MEFSNRTFVRNKLSEHVVLALEPWGREITMPPGFRVEVVISGPPGDLEIEHGEKRITLYGWAGTTIETFHDGEEIF